MKFMVIIEQGATSYGASVPDLPGCVAVGETEAEVLELIEEAIQLHLQDLQASGQPFPTPKSKSTIVDVPLAA